MLSTPTVSKTNTTQSQNRRFLRISEVEKVTGFKRTYIYILMKEGKFPKSVHLGMRSVAWVSDEIDRWVDERIAARDSSAIPCN